MCGDRCKLKVNFMIAYSVKEGDEINGSKVVSVDIYDDAENCTWRVSIVLEDETVIDVAEDDDV